jgi:hypothetical protein
MSGSRRDVAGALVRLGKVFNRPFDPKQSPGLLDEYSKALAGLSASELAGAIDVVLESAEHFPMPAVIRQAAATWRERQPRHSNRTDLHGRYEAWVKADYSADGGIGVTACPVCGREATWSPRLMADCDAIAHATHGILAECLPSELIGEHRRAWRDRQMMRAVVA